MSRPSSVNSDENDTLIPSPRGKRKVAYKPNGLAYSDGNIQLDDEESIDEEKGNVLPFVDKVESSKKRFRTLLIKLICIIVAVLAATIIFAVPGILKGHKCAHRCLAILVFVGILWASEAIPIWTTALLIPPLVTWLRVMMKDDQDNVCLDAADTADIVTKKLFDSTVLLAFGAFTMTSALSKYEISVRLAQQTLSRVGTNPKVVMATIMFLGVFMSMWISNVASPVVCLSLVQPILRSLSAKDRYAKALLLGIAFSNNIGGMPTPISSPQNINAFNTINEHGPDLLPNMTLGERLNWGNFMAVALPYSLLCTAATFVFLWLWFRPKLEKVEPLPPVDLAPLSWRHAVVGLISVLTIVLWAVNDQVKEYLGSVGMISLIPVVVFFGFGFLTVKDFKALSWDVLMLLAGGVVLGEAIQNSGLLHVIAFAIKDVLNSAHASTYLVLVAFGTFTWLFANFISHTVASIIILPIVASVACELAGGISVEGSCSKGHWRALVVGSVLLDSGAMALPVTSFPNAATFAEKDKDGNRYLSTLDFIKTGFLAGFIEIALMLAIGYWLLTAVL